MYVAGSTDCFIDLSIPAALERLADLEYTRVEIAIREGSPQLAPSQVLADLDGAVTACRETHRLKPVAYFLDLKADGLDLRNQGESYFKQFEACCRLAKATKVVSITVPAAELGTPFNAEIERLRELVRIATIEGVLVSVTTEVGRITQDPDTAMVICDNVKGLGLTLDPSHYICGPYANASIDNLFKYVYHTRLRDSKKDAFQVRVGQGEVEYGRLAAQLGRVNYNAALCVHITPQEGIDHSGEMRKLRLLLESLT